MPQRMIELIRTSSVPATLMHAAARGALSISPADMIEILVHLASHNKIFGQQARMTLAGWDEKSSLSAAADPNTPKEVLDYFVSLENLRPPLLPVLLENSSIGHPALILLATMGSREVIEAMRRSPRVQNSPAILHAMTSNPNATPQETAQMHEQLVASGFELSLPETGGKDGDGTPAHASTGAEAEVDEGVIAYISEHAKEIAAEEGKPFQPLGGIHEFEPGSHEIPAVPVESKPAEVAAAVPGAGVHGAGVSGAAGTVAPAGQAAAAAKALAQKKSQAGEPEQRGSALQKISRLDIKGRIQLAMKGTKEERSILVRDSTKLVALAVLESPKITDGEVEKVASQKNVLESLLRQIPMKRRFMKNYGIVRNLVANPRTPIDVSLPLMKNLLTADLRNLSSNKEVSDTIRKLATKMYKQKMDTTKKSSG